MIQSQDFTTSREIARLPFGRNGRSHFLYAGDVRHQWDSSRAGDKILEMIGQFSVEPERTPLLRMMLGPLSAEEITLSNELTGFYADIAKLTTSLPTSLNLEPDLLETLLDFRLLRDHVRFPCRVLDIGPGIGRRAAALFAPSAPAGTAYVGVESIEAPYVLQNMVGSLLSVRNPAVSFVDYLDFQSARKPLSLPSDLPGGSIVHMPLWAEEFLPSRAFDLIICNYILDEVTAADLDRIASIIGRCLAREGVVYCRGSQQKSMIKDLYLFGYGTYHQQDITRKLLSQNLRTKDVRLVGDTLTRFLVRVDSQTHSSGSGPFFGFREDAALIDALQQDFIHDRIAELKASKTPVLLWMDPDHQGFAQMLLPELDGVNLLGVTSDHVHHSGPGPFGLKQIALPEIAKLKPGAFVIAGRRIKLAHRELSETLGKSLSMRWFSYPVAFVYTWGSEMFDSTPRPPRNLAASVRRALGWTES
jgi:SAM-dependent methyltransferase